MENHMVTGGNNEPNLTVKVCIQCDEFLPVGTKFKVFNNTDEEVVICESCNDIAVIRTAEMPVNESED